MALAFSLDDEEEQQTTEPPRRVLAVDDDPTALLFLDQALVDLGYEPVQATNGQDALDILTRDPQAADIIVLDRMMPGMDGLDVMRRLSRNPQLRNKPVIMLTGANDQEAMREGIDAGVFYYLSKPIDAAILQSVISAAFRQVSAFRTLSADAPNDATGFHTLTAAKFNIRTLDEAERLAGFLANCFPDPDRVLTGLGALLVNAVEHGICGIGYETKGELLKQGTWRDEIVRRQALPENDGRGVEVVITRKDDGLYVGVTDPGPGFDWRAYTQIDAARASDLHGRGIAQARSVSFDKLSFNEQGNKALGFVSTNADIDW